MPLVVQIKLERQHLLEMVAFLCSILGGGRVLSQVDTRTPPREFVAIHNSFLKCRLCRAAVGLWFKFCILEGKKSDLAILSLSQSMETKKLMLTLLGSRCAGGQCLCQGFPIRPSLPGASSLLTLHVIVGFAAGHPLAPLEAPVVGVRQHHLYEHVVVGGRIESVYVEAQERKHAPVQGNRARRSNLITPRAGPRLARLQDT